MKFCNQLITNPMEVMTILYFYLQSFFIYFFMYMSKIASIINWILRRLFFWFTLPCFCLGMSMTKFSFFQKSIPIDFFLQPRLAYFWCWELVIKGSRNWTLDGNFFALINFFLSNCCRHGWKINLCLNICLHPISTFSIFCFLLE